ncbi:hypothetical protein BH92_07305 [Rhodococcoides fascians A21d2]|uniref:hypothetical protein n=1 Tax=Rhodococcoides fascians TaxID=1828 RepID=UPI0012D3132C|nr:hypothetical protein [Rhodococcus fascians]QIH99700.1 hypothetical protein BH92_07305 [Rhodococcus fascians A21d2]
MKENVETLALIRHHIHHFEFPVCAIGELGHFVDGVDGVDGVGGGTDRPEEHLVDYLEQCYLFDQFPAAEDLSIDPGRVGTVELYYMT